MCGVLGYVGSGDGRVDACLARLSHRGPDDAGTYSHGAVSLGHRRLSIIDVSSKGHQPMASTSGRSVITFNGEIYNYKDLKNELIAEGASFISDSDTEVILEGYERHGTAFFERMRGMWALVLYDIPRQELVCARDSFGIKPLYYTPHNNGVYLASEIRCFKEAGLSLEPNTSQYSTFYNLGYFIAPHTSYKNVFKLCPGEVLRWDIEKGGMRTVEHVSRFSDRPGLQGNGTYEAAVEALDLAFTDSVEAHYVADVPVSLLLSGGNDSSLIAALSKKIGKQPTAYHIAVPGSNDTYYAKRVAESLGVHLVVEELSQDALAKQYEKVWDILDEPTSDTSIIPTSLVYEQIKGQAKVVLSGDGGDELFGGYGRHRTFMRHVSARRAHPANTFFNTLLSPAASTFSRARPLMRRTHTAFLSRGIMDDLIGAYLKGARIIGHPIDDAAVRNALFDLYEREKDPRILPSLLFDMVAYLPNNLLYKTDTASMASSIEARVPLVDRHLYGDVHALLQTIDAQKATNNKQILKHVLERYLPADLVNRPKRGFSIPMMEYDTRAYMADFNAACEFHLQHRDTFAVGADMKSLIDSRSSREAIARTHSRFAFALISNWKIHA